MKAVSSLVAEIGRAAARVRYGDISAVEVVRRGACEGEARADVGWAIRSLFSRGKFSSIRVIPFNEGFGRTAKVEDVLCERGEI